MEANEESLYRRRERLSLKSMPNHPTHKTIYQPKYTAKFAAKSSAIPTYGIRTTNLLNDSNIKLEFIAIHQEPNIPMWTIDEPMVRLDLRIGIKQDIDPTIFQIKFNNLQEMYDNHVFLMNCFM